MTKKSINVKMLFKKSAAFLLSAAMILQPVTVVSAYEQGNKILSRQGVELTEVQPEKAQEIYGKGFVKTSDHVPASVRTDNSISFFGAESLPASYITPNLPTVKNQGYYGTCWAFATMGCIETNLIKKGYEEMDLSEMHLVYFAYNSVADKLGGFDGENSLGYNQ